MNPIIFTDIFNWFGWGTITLKNVGEHMKYIFVLFFNVFLVGIISCNNTTEAEKLGKVIGHMFNESTMEPINNVLIGIRNKETYSNQTGYFELANIEVGELDITAIKTHYRTHQGTIQVKSGDNVYDISLLTDRPPDYPYNPSPGNNELNVSVNHILSWRCNDPDGDPLIYDVNLRMVNGEDKWFENLSTTSVNPGILKNNAKYRWGVRARDNHGNSTVMPTWGVMWEFETE